MRRGQTLPPRWTLVSRLPWRSHARVRARTQLVIGIAGGTGSGKTTLARALVAELGPERCALIEHDAYYRDLSRMSLGQRSAVNFDHPDALDSDLLVRHLETLRDGRGVDVPVYDFGSHTRLPDVERVPPRPVVVVDGILLFAVPRLRESFDLRVFVEAPSDLRFIRRLQRDTVERARTVDSVCRQYLNTVRPMHEQMVEPSRRHAHLVVSGVSLVAEAVRAIAERAAVSSA